MALQSVAQAVDLSKPTARLDTPRHYRQIKNLTDTQRNAYFVALAAWQRGLQVTFHYEVTELSERFTSLSNQGAFGEIFSVTDGKKTHFFRRSLGDLTSLETSLLANDKPATKECLTAAGIDTPAGIVLSPSKAYKAKKFVEQQSTDLFILKPIDGSLSKDVEREVPAEEVVARLKARTEKNVLLEEFVAGPMYRVNVVGGLYVASYTFNPCAVVGDGKHSIKDLIELVKQPLPFKEIHEERMKYQLSDADKARLQSLGYNEDTVLDFGEKIVINNTPSGEYGADHQDTTETLPVEIRAVAAKAAKAMNLPVVGFDIIHGEDGRVVVLEGNQSPMVGSNVLPRVGTPPGNRVAEAIIDLYFPGSINNTRHVDAYFDFLAITKMLIQGVASSITVPTIYPHWEWKEFTIEVAQLNQEKWNKIRSKAAQLGLHVQAYSEQKGVTVAILAAPRRAKAFLSFISETLQ